MELTREKINEVAYALLLAMMSKEKLELDPEQFKRKLGNFPQQLKLLPAQFRSISQEEVQEASRVILHDLVDYAFDFTLKKSKKADQKESKV